MNQISFGGLTNFNSAVPWGLWVVIYIWLVGISAGSFLLIGLGNLMNSPYLKKISRLGISFSLGTLLAGLLSILIDLGHIERFYKLFISPSPSSVMAWMVWLYSFYAVILAFALFKLKKGLSKLFFSFGSVFALAVIVVESLLFALPPGRHWHSLIFPAHFFTSSLVSAIAGLIFAAAIVWVKDEKSELLRSLGRVALPLVIINLLVEIVDIVSLHNGGNWYLVLANIVVVALLLKRSSASITTAGLIGLIAIILSKYHSLVSAQLIEPFKGFAAGYIEPRIRYEYSPTSFEYAVSLFLVGLALGLFYFIYKIFPLTREE